MDCRAVLVSATDPDDAKLRYLEANNVTPDDLDPDNEDFEVGFSVEPLKAIVDSACSYHEIIQW